MNATAQLADRQKSAVARGVATKSIYVARAQNAELWDVDGKRYIDFAAGIAVVNTGHCHPKVIAAVTEQAKAFTHTCFHVAPYESYVSLAERLNSMTPGDFPKKTMLVTTGAEAVENAVKIARAHTGRPGVIAFAGAFHGRTALTMSLTGKVAPYRKKFGTAVPNIYHLPFPTPDNGVTVAETLRALDTLFRADIEPAQVAAIIIEPVQGEGGFHPAPIELLEALRAVCDQHGILLIADEIQTGFARTGKMFGIEVSGVEPDLVTMAKSLAGGFPLSGVLGKAAIMDAPEPGGLGGTYAGNPLALVAALAVLDVIEEEKLVARAEHVGRKIKDAVTKASQRNDTVPVANLRGPGAMVAFDIVRKRGTSEPDADATKRVIQSAIADGLVLLSCGVHGNTLRILVPLTASDAILDEGLAKLEKALVAANG